MRSRISFFDKAAFRKNITRFAPVWCVYGLCMLVGLFLMYGAVGNKYYFVKDFVTLFSVMAVVNLLYAPLAAVLLFGDLFNSRMCNALHALPLRRETWFSTHVITGILVSFLPNLLMALLAIPLLSNTIVVEAWKLAPVWLLVVTLQFICFFGIAVFSIHCAGNKLGAGGMYLMLNWGAMVIYAIIDEIYTPMLRGVNTPFTLTEILSPVVSLTNQRGLINLDSMYDLQRLFTGREAEMLAHYTMNLSALVPMLLYGLAGIGFLAAAYFLYRRRDLETAGDALAWEILKPVAAVALTIGSTFVGVYLAQTFFYSADFWVTLTLMILTMGAGWFLGWLIIGGGPIFRWKRAAGFLGILLFFGVTLGLTKVDILGIETWIPEQEEIASISISSNASNLEVTDPEDIAKILKLHGMILAQEDPSERVPQATIGETKADQEQQVPPSSAYVNLYYRLKNGREVNRHYEMYTETEAGDIVRELLSRWEVVSKTTRADLLTMGIAPIGISSGSRPISLEAYTVEAMEALYTAMQRDCEARTLTQGTAWHSGRFEVEEYGQMCTYSALSIWIEFNEENPSFSLDIYPDSRNVLAWAEQYGIEVPLVSQSR